MRVYESYFSFGLRGETNIYSKIVREKTVKEMAAQTETEITEMYSLKSYVANIEYFTESSARAAECAQFFDKIRVEKLSFTTRMMDSCFDSTEF